MYRDHRDLPVLTHSFPTRRSSDLLVGQGPRPGDAQEHEVAGMSGVHLRWLDEPLDWLAHDEAGVRGLGARLSALADDWNIDLLHLNLPSQAADLETDRDRKSTRLNSSH